MKRTLVVTALAAAVALLGQARAVADDEAAKAVSDNEFIQQVSAANLADINIAKLAVRQSPNAEVKKYAQRLLDGHAKAGAQLDRIADRLKVVPAARMDAQHTALANRLATMSGADFDREFVHHMVMDHHKAISLFESEAKNGKDPDLRAFASKMLPTLREHLRTAESLEKKEKGGR